MRSIGSHSLGCRYDETFVGNVRAKDGIPADLRGLKTARLGELALDIYGDRIDPEYMLPLFVGREEIDAYNAIRERRFRAIRGGRDA